MTRAGTACTVTKTGHQSHRRRWPQGAVSPDRLLSHVAKRAPQKKPCGATSFQSRVLFHTANFRKFSKNRNGPAQNQARHLLAACGKISGKSFSTLQCQYCHVTVPQGILTVAVRQD